MPGLRPLGLGEILDVGIKLYLRHWRPLMACVVWVVLPVQVISVLITLSIAPEQLRFGSTSGTGVTADEVDAFLASQGVIAILQAVVYVLATAACFKAVADAYIGGTPAARRSLGFAARRLPALLLLSIVAGVALVLAFIALIVPGIWLAVAWSLAIPVLLFERVSPFGALGRSHRLVKGRWWKVAVTIMIGVLLVSFLGGVMQGILLAVPTLLVEDNEAVAAFATVVANTIGSVITTPFTAAVVALIYFDQRVRKEGFDLQLLADGLGEEGEPRMPLPAAALLEPEVTAAERAAAPYWPPPPGWKPPEPAAEEPPAPPPGSWQPPQPPRWPPDEPARGPGGL